VNGKRKFLSLHRGAGNIAGRGFQAALRRIEERQVFEYFVGDDAAFIRRKDLEAVGIDTSRLTSSRSRPLTTATLYRSARRSMAARVSGGKIASSGRSTMGDNVPS
jgi:hypothetical protein